MSDDGTTAEPDGVRLQKVLARAGVGSRRASEELMAQGRVAVDGEVVEVMGMRVDPATAVIHVDGRRIPPVSDFAYVVVNKPLGVVSTMSDPQGRPSLAEVVRDRPERLFHVGRLDADTEGLLLLTNHGELAHRLAHPSFEIAKTYVAEVSGVVRPRDAERLKRGVELEDGPAAADSCTITQTLGDRSILTLRVHIGRNRVVRRMLDAVGHPVTRLVRTSFGPVHLGEMSPGVVRDLADDEIGALLDAVGL